MGASLTTETFSQPTPGFEKSRDDKEFLIKHSHPNLLETMTIIENMNLLELIELIPQLNADVRCFKGEGHSQTDRAHYIDKELLDLAEKTLEIAKNNFLERRS